MRTGPALAPWDGALYAANTRHHRVYDGAFLDTLPLRPGDHVLDLGCGSGDFTAIVAEQVPDGIVVGLEPQPSLLAEARACARPNQRFVEGRVQDLGSLFPNGEAFDVVMSRSVLHWVALADHPAAAGRGPPAPAARWLVPGGVRRGRQHPGGPAHARRRLAPPRRSGDAVDLHRPGDLPRARRAGGSRDRSRVRALDRAAPTASTGQRCWAGSGARSSRRTPRAWTPNGPNGSAARSRPASTSCSAPTAASTRPSSAWRSWCGDRAEPGGPTRQPAPATQSMSTVAVAATWTCDGDGRALRERLAAGVDDQRVVAGVDGQLVRAGRAGPRPGHDGALVHGLHLAFDRSGEAELTLVACRTTDRPSPCPGRALGWPEARRKHRGRRRRPAPK